MPNLRTLTLDGNDLTSIPDVVGTMEHLITLDVSDNQLSQLPSSLSGMIAIQWMYLYLNNLTTLPDDIGTLDTLTFLDASRNELTGALNSLS